MSDAARVSAIEAMHEARAALAEFAETVGRTLAGVDAEVYRMDDWLRRDRPAHWKRQVRARQDAVQQARGQVARKVALAAPDPSRAVEEREALRHAQRRLEEAQRRGDASRRWAQACARQAMEYKAGSADLRAMVAGKIPEGIARIGRMMEAVEAYLRVAPPRATSQERPGDRPESGVAATGDPRP